MNLFLFRFRLCMTASMASLLLASLALAHEGHEGHEGDHDHDHASTSEDQRKIFTTRGEHKSLPLTKEEDVFHFVIYGDRTGGVPAGLKVLEQAVVDTNLLDPDLVMTVGDLIQGYNEPPEWMEQMVEFKEIMNGLKMRWFPVAGNHDVYWRGKTPPPPGQHESNYEKHFGPLWYSFRHKDAGFIVLYSDEGDPETNAKGFHEGRLQTMSDAQLDFLKIALDEHKERENVFVFLHHPRWVGRGYAGGNWDVVHETLKSAGNVSAVFAGHIHQMRFDGPKDGIEYYALATTGGHLSADFPGAGYLHHLNVVTVRKSGISVSALPIGSVIDPKDFTEEFLAEMGKAQRIRPEQTDHQILLDVDGSASGTLEFTIKNPASNPVDVTVSLDQPGGDWKTTLDHDHFTVAAGQSKLVELELRRLPDPKSDLVIPRLRLDLDYVGESARIALPPVFTPIAIGLSAVPADYFADQPNRCLNMTTERDAVRIESSDLKLGDGPFTLEAWVNPSQLAGMRGVVAKTESSEFAIFMDEGVPQFDVHLNGKYVSAKATGLLSVGQWTHLAGVFDGTTVRLYVNGNLAGSTPGQGTRKRNRLPLYIGADTNPNGGATRSFLGKIDEVRITEGADYADAFSPVRRLTVSAKTKLMLHLDRTIGPFVLDQSSSATMGLLGESGQLVAAD
ncbi:cyclic 3',5'-adenosine monophosphate phosphodiesterase [Rubripirellula tenax]|uniref:Cyclic 3',5'-adenosine monophosphate phosphodiesterase n=1 Tax=Rubripirellula tenax TaxID=2528015 RepID=A0A5C6EC32_9BACT|nr:LamG-like jellyroll fold domain-containing protein [Rubripirellula tenax]TWU46290.1 cyclic 3',5'-adenosine monophosphate phosphodiesterase [Rubripirellula tenax]